MYLCLPEGVWASVLSPLHVANLTVHSLTSCRCRCCLPHLPSGIGFLPCGWEVGYNHYHGRRGLPMPQTAKLLSANRPEKYVFHWGLGTLTHYGTAEVLCPHVPVAPS